MTRFAARSRLPGRRRGGPDRVGRAAGGPAGGWSWAIGPTENVSIATIFAAVGALVVVVLAAVTWQIVESRARLRDQLLAHQLSEARIAAAVVEADLRSRLRLVESFAGRPHLVEQASAGRWAEGAEHLRDLRRVNAEVEAAALLDELGTVRARVPPGRPPLGEDLGGREEIRRAMRTGRPSLSESFATPEGSRVVAFAAPLRDRSGAGTGALWVTLPVAHFEAVRRLGPGEDGSLQVFDRGGRALTGPAAAEDETFARHPVVSAALAGRAGAREARVPGVDGIRLAAYAPVSPPGWAVLIEVRPAVAFRPLAALTSRMLGIVALVVGVAVLAGLVVVRLVRNLAAQRRQMNAVLRSMAEGVVVTDAQRRIVATNPAHAEISGWRDEELIGRTPEVIELLDAEGRPVDPERRPLRRALDSREPVMAGGFGLLLATRDGRRVPVSVAAAPILDARGEVAGGVVIVRDATPEWEVDQIRQSIVSTVSHELRTPLTMIQGFSELLLAGTLGEDDTRQALSQIGSAARRLSRLIDDLLVVARLESGAAVPQKEPVDLASAVREAIAPFERQRRFHLEVPREHALADRDMLVQILTNLVSNAVKYSPPDTPISVVATSRDGRIELSVQDRGHGLGEEELGRLFEKFYRAEREETRRVSGTGLGLYITRELVRLHQGEIWVESVQGEGTTFTFSLPVPPERPEEAP